MGDNIRPSDNQLLFFRRVKWAIMLWHSRSLDTVVALAVMHVSYSYSYIVTQLCGQLQLQLRQHPYCAVCQDQFSSLLIYFVLYDSSLVCLSSVALIDMKCDQQCFLLFMSTRLVKTNLVIIPEFTIQQILQVVGLNQQRDELSPSISHLSGLSCVKRIIPSKCWWWQNVWRHCLSGRPSLPTSHRSETQIQFGPPGVRSESEANVVL